ncbi:J domain-containing protein [Deminuibacter soli]|uniref:J domain-containing protein n=1 Tax=Deminuibacter soli TaxID=2291815 RepID=A0A3E1NFH6_9BACT|nr:DnaJ domain-containing protein [Deminuibacter soli]RFM26561.1 hypothetical protein DXN05_18460 [Deminuibacter soli]
MDYTKDYYSILGVDSKCTPETLRAAYRRLANQHHPDKNPGDAAGAEERFKAINEAYEVLSNEINRAVYDEYRAAHEQVTQLKPATTHNPEPVFEPGKTTRTKTYTVVHEQKVYVQGTIDIKFQGEPELTDTYAQQWEQRFTIIPTEVLATIFSSHIYNDPPAEYLQAYAAAHSMATPLKQPVTCRVMNAGEQEYYQLWLYDIRVQDPVLKDMVRHEAQSFGTLQGQMFGYVLHQYEENITEEYTEYSGPTGRVETKTDSDYIYTRQEFYAPDGSTYWANWKKYRIYKPKPGTPKTDPTTKTPVYKDDDRNQSAWWWLVALLLIVIIRPGILLILAPFLFPLLVILLARIASLFAKLLPWLGAIITCLLLFSAMFSLLHTSHRAMRVVPRRSHAHINSARDVVQGQNQQADTIIRHNLQWEDRDSTHYAIQLSIPSSAIHQSAIAHEQMDEQQYAALGIGAVYRSMLQTDDIYITSMAGRFDSLAKARFLDRQHEASMIVSCIQSIPYALVVNKSCYDNYTDSYVNQYLSRCNGDCCKGYSKFGVQSPVEFMGDLKGDCDTRALLLYDILGKLGYKVALLTSTYYKHALIAVDLDEPPSNTAIAIPVNGAHYYLWETTATGFGPGQIPANLADINRWNVTLLQ